MQLALAPRRLSGRKATTALLFSSVLLTLPCAALSQAQKGRTKRASPVFAYAVTEKGTLYGYKVAENGELVRLPSVTVIVNANPLQVAVDPSGAFLYVARRLDVLRDGYNMDVPREKARKVTELNVYRITDRGAPTLQQNISVDGVIGAILPHPAGKFVYCVCEGGDVRIFRTDRKRGLIKAGETTTPGGFSLYNDGSVDDAQIAFTPRGGFAFVSWETGLGDHHENYLQRFRVLASGVFKADGPVWEANGDTPDRVDPENPAPHPGPLTITPDGKTAFSSSLSGRLWMYRVGSTGSLSPVTKRRQRTVPDRDARDPRPYLNVSPYVSLVDPQSRYVITNAYAPDENDQEQVVYRLPQNVNEAADRVQTLGKTNDRLFAEPTGQFLYALTREPIQARRENAALRAAQYAVLSVWKVSDAAQFALVTPPRTVFPEPVSNLVFVAPPPGSR